MDQAWMMGINLPMISDGQADLVLSRIMQMAVVIQIVMLIVGVLICCFGLKLVRVLSVFAGLVIGSGIGTGAALGLGFSGTMIPVTILLCTVVMAVFCCGVRKLGIFFVVLLHTTGIAASLLLPGIKDITQAMIVLGVSVFAALLMAVFAVIKPELVVVIITGISGGLSVGTAAAALLGITGNIWVGYGISAAAAFIGIWIQFMMQSRKIGKNERVYAERMKGQVSRESEVEKARRILEEEDEETEKPKSSKADRKSSNDDNDDDDDDDDITIITMS
ncbi:hypothetical protein [Sporofaciens musculi]|uniref:hypothetical protein n=1 Tax=Sporofaciens musculi TaxID=2681861 RepID=UPI00259CD0C7|nr:hypothetical protein [Sporofaciens musculi]